jgi:thymidylate synthase
MMEAGYLNALSDILENGEDKQNRTSTKTRALFGIHLKWDMSQGAFPLITTKKMAWSSIVGELIGFIQAAESAEDFRNLGCSVWDANANDPGTSAAPNAWVTNPFRKGENDLGHIYGYQWRKWESFKTMPGVSGHENMMRSLGYTFYCNAAMNPGSGDVVTIYRKQTDQLAELIHKLRYQRTDRRMIVTAWNPGELDQMALPPCHQMFQCFVHNDGRLDLEMTQRSCDFFLGVPFNIASYALLLLLLAQVSDLKPGVLGILFNDAHIYHNHFDAVREQLTRPTHKPPCVILNKDIKNIDDFRPAHIELCYYNHHPAIKAKMAL